MEGSLEAAEICGDDDVEDVAKLLGSSPYIPLGVYFTTFTVRTPASSFLPTSWFLGYEVSTEPAGGSLYETHGGHGGGRRSSLKLVCFMCLVVTIAFSELKYPISYMESCICVVGS